MTKELKFESPTFMQRIKGMLGVDFYRLFHTPLFYIFLCIAAIIPAMVGSVKTFVSLEINRSFLVRITI